MPLYEYRCQHCGKVTEIYWEEFDGGPTQVECSHCKGDALKILSIVSHKNKKKGRP